MHDATTHSRRVVRRAAVTVLLSFAGASIACSVAVGSSQSETQSRELGGVVTTKAIARLPFGIGPARVRAWAGKPEFTSPPSRLGAYPFPNAPHGPQEIVVLGYHCVGQSPATGNAGGSSCHTLFGFRRGKLTSFQTDSRLFSFASGVHPGMTLREARRREPTATSDPGNVGCTRLRVRSPKGTARAIYHADWPQATRVFSLYVSSGDPAFNTSC
jgi:hypothetical protein